MLISLTNTSIDTNVVEEKPCNCCTPSHQEFDYWVGEWVVYDTSGTVVGSNSITKVQAGCALQENWVGGSGFTGTSLNYYDAKTDKWNQVWIDQSGSVLNLSGKYNNGQMILVSEEAYSEKQELWYQNRIIWTKNDDGTVRQLWESTTDKGKTWNTVFDGLYKRRSE
jgi:hypothetical protein